MLSSSSCLEAKERTSWVKRLTTSSYMRNAWHLHLWQRLTVSTVPPCIMKREQKSCMQRGVVVLKPTCAWHIDVDIHIQVCKDPASSYSCQNQCTSAVSQRSSSHCCFDDDLHTSQLHRYTRLLCSRTQAMAHMLSYKHSIQLAASPHLAVMFGAGMRSSVPGAACLRSLGCSQCCHPCMCIYQPTPKGRPCSAHCQWQCSI